MRDKFDTVALCCIMIGAMSIVGILGPIYTQNESWFHHRYGDDNCGFLYHCYTMSTTITSVRDYDIQCTDFWGTTSTCPRELVSMVPLNSTIKDAYQYDPSYSLTSWTVNCHYYHPNDTISFQERLDFRPLYNTTHVEWSLVGSPC